MNKKILFTDLDGTLLNDEKEISEENQLAIDEALQKGHFVVISTGRPLPSARIQANRLGLVKEGCFAITYNGAQIYDFHNEKTIYKRGVPHRLVAPLFEAAASCGLHFQTYSDTHVIAQKERPELIRYSGILQVPYLITDHIEEALAQDPYKFLAIDPDHDKLEDFQKNVLSRYSDHLTSFFSNEHYLEIVPLGISKGFAVTWLCDYLNIPIENSVAAGDAQNDIEMLQAAHIGAVMCNAFPGVAQYGDYVTEADNNHSGLAEIIRRFIL
ncbi:Cof-type HAD-IIB family hydrolase [Parablautia sp. Marseille-Q6255]|uniref:Cof-type HAD-IIB family hydrolase n=1 Tax=Parablautia sp. Marseille-Q6255 TaxID=3039593 RepID=UPI0024BCB755|nr:Cof-type HAD-IIB family hydrolase [Parablautia sp. Marseille-Q6255]